MTGLLSCTRQDFHAVNFSNDDIYICGLHSPGAVVMNKSIFNTEHEISVGKKLHKLW